MTRSMLQRLALVGVVLLLLSIIAILTADVRGRLVAIEEADSDNGQWVMMQTEVEALRFRYALLAAQSTKGDLAEVRRWFDVLYSRTTLLETSPLYSEFASQEENNKRISAIKTLLDSWVPLIDGPDDALRAALPKIEAESGQIQEQARRLSLDALVDFSADTDANRTMVTVTLLRLAVLSAATIAMLLLVTLGLARLYRITQQQAEENLATGARLQIIIASSPDAILVTNRGGWVVEFNPAAEEMFGLSRAEMMGRLAVPEIFPAENLPEYQPMISAAIARATVEGPVRIELEAQRKKDGHRFPIELSIAARSLDRGTLFVAFMRDISKRKADDAALDAALQQARSGEKTKARFMAVMSHEMRTPLNGLIGSMNLLQDTELNENQQELLRIMQFSGRILLGHVNSVLDISLAEAGEIRPNVTEFDLDELIADCILNQKSLAQQAGNSLVHVPLSGRLGRVMGDPARLRQILLNLIGNAVKFTRDGTVTVETERLTSRSAGGQRDMVEFRVIDTGIGIAVEEQERIFEDFHTIDSSYRRQTEGTGLGLGIVRRLTEALGGAIGVESEPGEGSVFWLRLPLAIASPASALALAGAPIKTQTPALTKPQKPLDILILEDNDINRMLLRRVLEDGGHHVTEATDGLEGVEIAETKAFDVIITDISMPRMDGIEATRAIRSGAGPNAKTRVIALTAHALPEEIQEFIAAGMDAVLTKPVNRDFLLTTLNQGKTSDMDRTAGDDNLLLNADALTELETELGVDMLFTLVGRMMKDGDDTVTAIAGHGQPDMETAKAAHQLAGSCATFGALRLRKVLASLETAVKTNQPDQAKAFANALPAIWQDTRVALAEHLATMDPKG